MTNKDVTRGLASVLRERGELDGATGSVGEPRLPGGAEEGAPGS